MTSPTFPIEKKFSARTRAKYGYKNARVEVVVKVGPIPFTEALTPQEINDAIEFLTDAKRFAEMPEEDRARIGAD